MKQTRELLDNIRKSIGEDSMSFIVGAGFSRNISEKFPLWGELLSPLVEEIIKVIENGNKTRSKKDCKINR